jgi:hypothetical protein
MSAVATETGTRGDARPQRRSTWASVRVWLTMTIIFCLLADLAVRLAEPHLAQPVAWPTPELQDKYDGVTKLAPGHHVRTVLFGDSMMDAGGDPALMHQVPGITYNASLAGETLGTIATWATNVVVPRLHPTTVVLGFNINALNPNIPGLANSQKTYKSSRVAEVAGGGGDIADHLDNFLRDHVALYEYRSVLRKVFQPRSGSDSTVYDPPLSSLGWNETFRSLHYNDGPGTTTVAQGLSETRGDLLFDFAVGSTEERQLGDLIERLHHEGAGWCWPSCRWPTTSPPPLMVVRPLTEPR